MRIALTPLNIILIIVLLPVAVGVLWALLMVVVVMPFHGLHMLFSPKFRAKIQG